jgi:ADP-heptose:LPS heptosyltransferase
MSQPGAPLIRFRKGRGILVVCRQGLGDAVQSLPLIQAVCRHAQNRCPVRVLFHSRPSFHLLQQEGLDFTPYFVVPDHDGLSGLLRLCSKLRGTTDLIISAPETSASKIALLRCALGSRYVAAEADPPLSRLFSFSVPLDWHRSFLQTQEDLASLLGLPVPLALPSITVTAQEASWAGALLLEASVREHPVLGVQCSAAIPDKKWPAENFGLVVRRLQQAFPALSVLSFGVKEEQEDTDRAREAAGGLKWIDGAGKWNIRQTLAALSVCDLFLSGDTGLMHMAAAVNTKTLSVFGPTSPARRAPFLQGGLALAPDTACHPCFRRKWRGCTCIRLVDVESVTALAERALVESSAKRLEPAPPRP